MDFRVKKKLKYDSNNRYSMKNNTKIFSLNYVKNEKIMDK